MGNRELRQRWSFVVAFVRAAVLAAGAAPPALAADPNEIAIDRMRLATERAGVLSVESGRVLPHLEMGGATWVGYTNDPLVLHRLGDDRRVASLVGDRSSGAVMAAMGILDRAQLAIEIPVVFHQSPQRGAVTPRAVDAFGLGSMRLVPKLRLLEAGRHGVDLAVLAGLSVPLGAGDFVGSELTLQPEIAASRGFREVRVAGNVGATLRDAATLADVRMGNELSAQLGAAWDLAARLGLPLEAGLVLAGAVSASEPFARSDETSVELRSHVAFDATPAVRLLAGGGAGLENGWGTPDWRIFAGAQLALSRRPLPGTLPPAVAATALPAPPALAAAPPAPPGAPPGTQAEGEAGAPAATTEAVGLRATDARTTGTNP